MKKEYYTNIFFKIIIICTLFINLTSCNYHTHTFSKEWCYDNKSHWHSASCEHKELKSDIEEHIFGEWSIKSCPTCTNKGYEHRTCKCGYEEIREKSPALDHNYDCVYSYNEEYHWRKCKNCDEIIDKNEHVFKDYIIDLDPTLDAVGKKHKECDICGYKKFEEIPMLEHQYNNKWSYDGDSHWHQCKDCDLIKDKGNHTYGEWYITREPTESNYGTKERKCTICGQTESITIPKLSS